MTTGCAAGGSFGAGGGGIVVVGGQANDVGVGCESHHGRQDDHLE